MWIGLNPSTADEQQLDPTLTRIRGFSEREGYDGFLMTNIFGFRATDPKVMRNTPDPVGPENDAALLEAAQRCDKVVAAWGAHGVHQDRALAAVELENVPVNQIMLILIVRTDDTKTKLLLALMHADRSLG